MRRTLKRRSPRKRKKRKKRSLHQRRRMRKSLAKKRMILVPNQIRRRLDFGQKILPRVTCKSRLLVKHQPSQKGTRLQLIRAKKPRTREEDLQTQVILPPNIHLPTAEALHLSQTHQYHHEITVSNTAEEQPCKA